MAPGVAAAMRGGNFCGANWEGERSGKFNWGANEKGARAWKNESRKGARLWRWICEEEAELGQERGGGRNPSREARLWRWICAEQSSYEGRESPSCKSKNTQTTKMCSQTHTRTYT